MIAKQLCGGHYKRASRGEPLDKPLRRKIKGGICTVPNCGRKYRANGLCGAHLERQRRGVSLDAAIREVFETDDLHERLRHYAPESAPDECWEWTRALNKGYGMISIGNKKLRGAHIVAWELANDTTLPAGEVVRHTCDNPPCTNPRHLVVGTHGDNVNDCVDRGRTASGVKNARAKLTADQVRAIRRMCSNGAEQQTVAERFGVKQANVSAIVLRKTWKYV